MQYLKTIFFMVLTCATTSSYATSVSLPDFSQYPVPENQIFKGKPASVDLSSFKGASKFKTKLQEGAKKGPNFAGRYTVITIGCGTNCQENWVVDAQNGKILDRVSSALYTQYRLDSTLMVINPPDPDFKKGYEAYPNAPIWNAIQTTFQEWKDDKFNFIHEDKWVDVIKSFPSS